MSRNNSNYFDALASNVPSKSSTPSLPETIESPTVPIFPFVSVSNEVPTPPTPSTPSFFHSYKVVKLGEPFRLDEPALLAEDDEDIGFKLGDLPMPLETIENFCEVISEIKRRVIKVPPNSELPVRDPIYEYMKKRDQEKSNSPVSIRAPMGSTNPGHAVDHGLARKTVLLAGSGPRSTEQVASTIVDLNLSKPESNAVLKPVAINLNTSNESDSKPELNLRREIVTQFPLFRTIPTEYRSVFDERNIVFSREDIARNRRIFPSNKYSSCVFPDEATLQCMEISYYNAFTGRLKNMLQLPWNPKPMSELTVCPEAAQIYTRAMRGYCPDFFYGGCLTPNCPFNHEAAGKEICNYSMNLTLSVHDPKIKVIWDKLPWPSTDFVVNTIPGEMSIYRTVDGDGTVRTQYVNEKFRHLLGLPPTDANYAPEVPSHMNPMIKVPEEVMTIKVPPRNTKVSHTPISFPERKNLPPPQPMALTNSDDDEDDVRFVIPPAKPNATVSPSVHVLRPEVDYGRYRLTNRTLIDLYQFISTLRELMQRYGSYTTVDNRMLVSSNLIGPITTAWNNIRALHKREHNASYTYREYNNADWWSLDLSEVRIMVINWCRETTNEAFVNSFCNFISQNKPLNIPFDVTNYATHFHTYFSESFSRLGFVMNHFYKCPITNLSWSSLPATKYTSIYGSALPPAIYAKSSNENPGLLNWFMYTWSPYDKLVYNWCGGKENFKNKNHKEFVSYLKSHLGDLSLTSLNFSANQSTIKGPIRIPRGPDEYPSNPTVVPPLPRSNTTPSAPVPPASVRSFSKPSTVGKPFTPYNRTSPSDNSSVRSTHSRMSDMTSTQSTPTRSLFPATTTRRVYQHMDALVGEDDETHTFPDDNSGVHPDDSTHPYDDFPPVSEEELREMEEAYAALNIRSHPDLSSEYLNAIDTSPEKHTAMATVFRGYCANVICFGKCSDMSSCRFDHSAAGREICIKSFNHLRLGQLQEHALLPFLPMAPRGQPKSH